eukprot:934725-Rhodomonas_salina.1
MPPLPPLYPHTTVPSCLLHPTPLAWRTYYPHPHPTAQVVCTTTSPSRASRRSGTSSRPTCARSG